jgi:hypothetical protein
VAAQCQASQAGQLLLTTAVATRSCCQSPTVMHASNAQCIHIAVGVSHQCTSTATVKHGTLLLGVGGAIYKEFGQTLSNDLGVRGRPLDTLLRKLHLKSVQAVGDMWKHRRALLHNKLGTKKGKTTGIKHAQPLLAHQQPKKRRRKK